MAKHSLYAVLVRELIRRSGTHKDWLPEVAAEDDSGDRDLRFVDGEYDRRVLRLLANSALQVLVACQDEFSNEIATYPAIVRHRQAVSVSGRLLEVAEWAEADGGENAGTRYRAAARLAEVVMEHYGDFPVWETYGEVADLYVDAINQGFEKDARESVLELLAVLEQGVPRKAARFEGD